MSKEQQTSFLDNHELQGSPALWDEAPRPQQEIRAEDLRTKQAHCDSSPEDYWRRELADRVAAHRARRGHSGSMDSATAAAPARARERSQQMLDNLERKMRERREAEERELQLRREREEAERREREELERFFAEFNRPVPAAEPAVDIVPRTASNVIRFPGPTGAAAAAAPAFAPEPLFVPVEDPETPGQLTIFEELPEPVVEPEPPRMPPRRAPALRLDEHYEPEPEIDEEAMRATLEVPLKVAPVEKRMAAAVIDSVIVTSCATVFGFIFYSLDHQLPKGHAASGIVIATLWVMWAIYQVLFLTYCGVTPGMKAQRLAISDFDDQVANPRQRFWRAISLLCTSLSLGLGFLWTFLEPDRLGWHDKMTRTFPRELA